MADQVETNRPLRVLQVHNAYQQRGGEDAVFEAEHDLLVAAGHRVEQYQLHNRGITTGGLANLRLGLRTIWSRSSARAIRAIVKRFQPDVAHVHNTLPLISPSIYRVLSKLGVPVVQTVHNYRLLCPAGTLFRDGAPCEDCVGRSPLPAVRHRCYRNSRAASGTVAAMLMMHRAIGTYARHIDRFLALTTFGRDKLIDGGLPPERIAVLPNFLGQDPGPVAPDQERRGVLFVGRLAEEKGVRTVLDAAARWPADLPLRIIGSGPLEGEARATAAACGQIEYLGAVPASEVGRWMRQSAVLVLPSLWYEGLPMTLIEAWQNSLPVAVSGLGALRELVDGEVGTYFRAGDAAHLAMRLQAMLRDPERLVRQGAAARARYEAEFAPDRHLEQLVATYHEVMTARRTGAVAAVSTGGGALSAEGSARVESVPGLLTASNSAEVRDGAAVRKPAASTETRDR